MNFLHLHSNWSLLFHVIGSVSDYDSGFRVLSAALKCIISAQYLGPGVDGTVGESGASTNILNIGNTQTINFKARVQVTCM